MTFTSEIDPNTKAIKYATGDCLDVMQSMPDKCVDLVFCSPPYEAARTYGVGFNLRGQACVDWCFSRFMECLRVSKGLVAWVMDGQTRNFAWSGTPMLLAADLIRAGVKLRKPPVYKRFSLPGSGGRDWLRNDYEFVLCASHGKLPWSDNTACGHAPRYTTGGAMSNRTKDGARRNAKTGKRLIGNNGRPKITNPGNVISGLVGGGHMGHPISHENEAPFPLWLAEFFVKSFCPVGGTVLDCFGGSGTTAHAALLHGRNAMLIDIRQSETDRAKRRVADVLPKLQPATTEQTA